MKVLVLALSLIFNLVTTQALAQDKKPRVTVIDFTDSDRSQKIEVDAEVKSASAKQNFDSNKLDAEILSLEEKLDKGVVYIQ